MILPGYHDVAGVWHDASPIGIEAARAAMSTEEAATWVVRQSDGVTVNMTATLVTEDGHSSRVSGHVEAPPLGYHRLHLDDGRDVHLIVSPGVCPRPARGWGWAVQLYAVRSHGGIGDFGDLRTLAHWKDAGSVLMVNPLHAAPPAQPSPYFPTSRRWLNPLYIRVPGLADAPTGLIDRAAVWEAKRLALRSVPRAAESLQWVDDQGDALRDFAVWCALAEEHGWDWRMWPPPLQDARSEAVRAWAVAHDGTVRFHAWLQWLAATQLGDCRGGAAIVTDLAVGCDPGGADTWRAPDAFASGVTIGAPPDEFSPDGQDWGLAPLDPCHLRAIGYEEFAAVLRAALRPGGGVRIDHVAGLFRSFWIPAGHPASEGVYVRYPWEDLLNVVALEAHRAGACVIGEDLGTVEPWVRDALQDRDVLSYRLVCFEDTPPAQWPPLSLGAVTTHDLPTIAGALGGSDDDDRVAVGLAVDGDASRRMCARLLAAGGDVVSIYRALSASPSLLVVGALEDALGVAGRVNHPGSVDEWPNWRVPLPLPLDDVVSDRRVAAAAAALRRP